MAPAKTLMVDNPFIRTIISPTESEVIAKDGYCVSETNFKEDFLQRIIEVGWGAGAENGAMFGGGDECCFIVGSADGRKFTNYGSNVFGDGGIIHRNCAAWGVPIRNNNNVGVFVVGGETETFDGSHGGFNRPAYAYSMDTVNWTGVEFDQIYNGNVVQVTFDKTSGLFYLLAQGYDTSALHDYFYFTFASEDGIKFNEVSRASVLNDLPGVGSTDHAYRPKTGTSITHSDTYPGYNLISRTDKDGNTKDVLYADLADRHDVVEPICQYGGVWALGTASSFPAGGFNCGRCYYSLDDGLTWIDSGVLMPFGVESLIGGEPLKAPGS